MSTTAEPAGGGDPFNLQRFIDAQQGVFEQACAELRAGRKTGHWIWFVFPQMKGLGLSGASRYYGLRSLAEARAYVAHPVLGPRLETATRLMLDHAGMPLARVLGSPDDLKFCSSMTLFTRAGGPSSVFAEALQLLCAGKDDPLTLQLIGDADRQA